MTDSTSTDELMNDKALIAELTSPDATRPSTIRPGELGIVRLLTFLSAPVWGSAIGVAMLWRLLRGRRPVLILHERVGYQRKPILVPKIATASIADNERRYGGLVEIATGPPATIVATGRFERWLRHSGVDELPQLGLIVRGQMRLVGPRPVTPDELNVMATEGDEVGVDMLQPGLVGLWQILDRHGYGLDERRSLDVAMIDNWSSLSQRRILAIAFGQAARRIRSR